jgi:hypothetical protein
MTQNLAVTEAEVGEFTGGIILNGLRNIYDLMVWQWKVQIQTFQVIM